MCYTLQLPTAAAHSPCMDFDNNVDVEVTLDIDCLFIHYLKDWKKVWEKTDYIELKLFGMSCTSAKPSRSRYSYL